MEDIAFQASILALRAAIEPAARDGGLDTVQTMGGSLHSLVERARALTRNEHDLRGL
jgi:hypothetical protein